MGISSIFFHAAGSILYRDITIDFLTKRSPIKTYDFGGQTVYFPNSRLGCKSGVTAVDSRIKAILLGYVKVLRIRHVNLEDSPRIDWDALVFSRIAVLRLNANNFDVRRWYQVPDQSAIQPVITRIPAPKVVFDQRRWLDDSIDLNALTPVVRKIVRHNNLVMGPIEAQRLYGARTEALPFQNIPASLEHLVLVCWWSFYGQEEITKVKNNWRQPSDDLLWPLRMYVLFCEKVTCKVTICFANLYESRTNTSESLTSMYKILEATFRRLLDAAALDRAMKLRIEGEKDDGKWEDPQRVRVMGLASYMAHEECEGEFDPEDLDGLTGIDGGKDRDSRRIAIEYHGYESPWDDASSFVGL